MTDRGVRGARTGESIFGEIKEVVLNLLGAGLKDDLDDARELLVTSRKAVEAIRHNLNIALDTVNALRRADNSEKAELIEKYRSVLESIDQKALGATHNGVSLIDESAGKLHLSQRGKAKWSLSFDHVCLTVGSGGLDLPRASELDNREVICDEAQGRLAGAVGTANHVLKLIRERLVDIDEKIEGFDKRIERSQRDLKDDARESASEIAKIVVMALVIALIFRSFFFQPFHIPSGSMKPTLLKGDYLFVSKYSYGYSDKSFPLGLNFFDGRIFHKEPRRGDVIVFKLTEDGRTDYIKRLVGLPGDKIQVLDGVLYVNDAAVNREPMDNYWYTDEFSGEQFFVPQFQEALPDGAVHRTLDLSRMGRNDNTGIYRVPEGHYFFMGDNRDNSQDSRVVGGGVGFVPAENLIGRAELIFVSVDGSAALWQIWKWPFAIRYSRLMKKIT